MGILKQIDNPNRNGATAEYWNIGELHYINRSRELRVTMHGYKDKEFREDTSNVPTFDIPFTISGDYFEKNMTYAQIYEYAKQYVEVFDGAEDDI